MNRSDISGKIQRILDQEKVQLTLLREEYRHCPKGTLYISCKKGYTCIYLSLSGKMKGIKKDRERVYALARKKYLEREIEIRQMYCDILQCSLEQMKCCDRKIRNKNNTSTYTRMMQMKNKDRIVLSMDAYCWRYGKYETNPYKPESLIYQTDSGMKVRSKSERTIANRLDFYNLLYHYEAKAVIAGSVFYPDFMIRKKDHSIVLWEHFGLMDQEDYYLRACQKIDKYRKAGFAQHTNLICTYEEDIKSEQVLDKIIERFLL